MTLCYSFDMDNSTIFKMAMTKIAVPAWQQRLLQGDLSQKALSRIAGSAGLTNNFFQKALANWRNPEAMEQAGMVLPASPIRAVLNNFRWALRERPFKPGDRLGFAASSASRKTLGS